MGFITNTPAGNYRANWRDPSGRQKARTFATKREARAFLADVEGAMNRGTYVDPGAGRIRFGSFAARWLISRDVEARTAERTLSVLRTHVLPRWADWPIGRIDYMSVQEWVSDLSRSLAPATVAKCYGVLLMVLQTAVRARLIAHNPAEGIRVPARPADEARPRAASISREEFFRKLLPALPEQHRAIVCTAAGAGLRWGECAGLPWEAVDLDTGVVHVRQVAVETPGAVTLRPYTKTRAGIRTVPLPAFLAEALRAERARLGERPAPEALVFPSRAGTPLRRSHFRRRVWTPAVVRSGLPPTLRFHDLRHSYATWLVSDGLPVNVVQRVMGHQQASTTLNRYTHTPSDYQDRVRGVLDASTDFLLTSGPEDDRDDGDEPGAAALVPA
jgi:integrase